MNKKQTLEYLNSLNRFGSVLGLDNIRQLLNELDNPQDKLKIIHVTGTNGKGSVCAYLAEIMKTAGYKTGVYNSPAVICEYDQYRIDGDIVAEKAFVNAVSKVKESCDILNKKNIFPTRFEVETAAAFVLFLNEKVDVAIIETGLGGRDDATAVISNAILHIFTTISEDHLHIIGDDIKEIAENKSHIIKSDAPTVAFKSDDDTFEVIRKRCEKFGSALYSVNENDITDIEYSQDKIKFSIRSHEKTELAEAEKMHNEGAETEHTLLTTSMPGVYQPLNVAVAIRAAFVLRKLGYNITDNSIISGIKNAYIPFRFEKICDEPVIIADGAHNPDGAKRLVDSLKNIYSGYDLVFVTGMFKDKDCDKICEITGGLAKKVFAVCNEKSERSLDANSLANILKKYNDNVSVCDTIEEGLNQAITYDIKNKDKITVLFGSLSWLNRARQYITTLNNIRNPQRSIEKA